jgi:ubiquinone/menaquinone biosynthesis C-methylase UbiE
MAETLPFRDETFDTIVCAQAFHWFDGHRALQEIHRVLKPRGAWLSCGTCATSRSRGFGP